MSVFQLKLHFPEFHRVVHLQKWRLEASGRDSALERDGVVVAQGTLLLTEKYEERTTHRMEGP